MARNSLRNLSTRSANAATEAPRINAGMLPADLRALLHQREALEARMAALTGRPMDNGDSRFPITPLSVRRAADDAWAAARDRRHAPGSPQDELSEGGLRQVLQATQTSASEPPQRTGQRAIQDLADRTGLRNLRNPATQAESDPLERMMRLRESPDLRDLTTALPEPRLPERPGALERASERLDILRGGSGDLDKLRALALSRRTARFDEARELERHRRPQDPDAGRDAARLDRRGTQGARTDNV
ncbi:hypothetical protein [Marinobacter sp.]|uniref:hypothetical protein n=1 Tax=Marinobacter sp. TaxID=50741 RepID=UPI003A8E0577